MEGTPGGGGGREWILFSQYKVKERVEECGVEEESYATVGRESLNETNLPYSILVQTKLRAKNMRTLG